MNELEGNRKITFFFIGLQLIVFLAVYTVTYGAFKGVEFAIGKYEMSSLMYFPVAVVAVIFPIFLYQQRKMLDSKGFLVALTWMMGTASLTILLLYIYVAQVV